MQNCSEVYCDKVVITTPPANFTELGIALNDIAESSGGGTVEFDTNYRQVRMSNGGLILLTESKQFARVTINGQACAELRLLKRFNEALGVLGSVPHKVTQLHAKLDYRPRSTPRVLAKLHKVALAGKLFGYDYQLLQSMPNMRPDRAISHNLYAPKVMAEIQRVYYDKTLERYKAGKLPEWSDDENLSVELRVSGRVTRKGLSLRDASEPTALYWHYMAECPVIGKYRPQSVPEWSSAGSSYEFPVSRRTPDEKLTDCLRFGGCFMQVAKLSAQLGRSDEFLREVQRQIRLNTPLLEGV